MMMMVLVAVMVLIAIRASPRMALAGRTGKRRTKGEGATLGGVAVAGSSRVKPLRAPAERLLLASLAAATATAVAAAEAAAWGVQGRQTPLKALRALRLATCHPTGCHRPQAHSSTQREKAAEPVTLANGWGSMVWVLKLLPCVARPLLSWGRSAARQLLWAVMDCQRSSHRRQRLSQQQPRRLARCLNR